MPCLPSNGNKNTVLGFPLSEVVVEGAGEKTVRKTIPKPGRVSTPFNFEQLKGGPPPLHSYSAGTLPALALPLAVAERAHPLPASSGPALGEEPEGGAEARGAAQPVSVASPAAAARGRTDGPGPGAAGAGLGRAGEFLSGAASLLRSAA